MKKLTYIMFVGILLLYGCSDTPKEIISNVKNVEEKNATALKIYHQLREKNIIGDFIELDNNAIVDYVKIREKTLLKAQKMSVEELLAHIEELPDGGAYSPQGDFYSQEIIRRGKPVVPLLIEQILNTSQSKVVLYNAKTLSIGDVAAYLIDYTAGQEYTFDDYCVEELNCTDIYVFPYSIKPYFIRSIVDNQKNKEKLHEFLKKQFLREIR